MHGGGWIMSPPGAYKADTTLAGRATFGFVSKYLKGATTPSGNTEFQFQAAKLQFFSNNYDWLVVGGARAQYKGTGTINGAGTYKFMLTAVDGQINGGGEQTVSESKSGITTIQRKPMSSITITRWIPAR